MDGRFCHFYFNPVLKVLARATGRKERKYL